MAIFEIDKGRTKRVRLSEFKLEKDLQKLVEENLETIFNCQFVATEFSTGSVHSGRIDTLALSEDGNPVIIEYKKVASSDLINQSLYYLHWISDHKGDYQVAVNQTLGKHVNVDWSAIRVICIAPEFKKYDLHAVQVMGANIELWQYKLYDNGILNLEEVFKRSGNDTGGSAVGSGKDPKMVEAGRKAAAVRKDATYTIDEHQVGLSANMTTLLNDVRDFIIGLDGAIEEVPKKFYIAYKTSQNFICIQTYKKKLSLYLKLNPSEVKPFPSQARNVSKIGHYGTGDLEVNLTSKEDFEETKYLIVDAFKNIGG